MLTSLIYHDMDDFANCHLLKGHLNTPLNATGRSQAQTVAKRLIDEEGVRFDEAFSSDSDRASDVSSDLFSIE